MQTEKKAPINRCGKLSKQLYPLPSKSSVFKDGCPAVAQSFKKRKRFFLYCEVFVKSIATKQSKLDPIPLPHRTISEPKGQDLDFVNVAHSHLVHSDWTKLENLSSGLTQFRVKHILLKIQKDYVLSLEFFKWVEVKSPNSNTLENHSIVLHVLTKSKKFKSAESILRKLLESGSVDFPGKLFEAILLSYRICDSSPRVFDSLFKCHAHLKKFRNASDTFCSMKQYGFVPTVESCNAFMSALLSSDRVDVALAFYKEMRRSKISPNVYTFNMVVSALCKSGKLEKAVEVLREMENISLKPTAVSYNTLIAGHCNRDLLSVAMKLKTTMEMNGIQPVNVTYNTLIHGLCKVGKLHEANKLFSEMKRTGVAPNVVTYNTLINAYSQVGNSEMGSRLFEEMANNGLKADILTYNALIMGLCKEMKTKKAALLVKELDNANLVPNSSTFSYLISGQCTRRNPDRAFQLYKSMVRGGFYPNKPTLTLLISTFIKNEDYDGAMEVLKEMLERSITPDVGMLTEICSMFLRCGRDGVIIKLLQELEAKRLMPEGFDKTTVLSTQVWSSGQQPGWYIPHIGNWALGCESS
uniref:Pentacotripeptide-repeat region of PRORP domain-containing protein n=1 Tax=Solanum lycopersicum TaxID=4081 RepID=A0A3Q7HAJ6_SOLLC